jgi:pyruvate ferredoxin oxidoreductase beta subunit
MVNVTEDLLSPGHRTCAGCGSILAARYLLKATGKDVIICEPTGCLEVTSSQYPLTAWKVPWIHVVFENAASVAAGVKVALEAQGNDHTEVIAFGGDGGMVDIGFGAVSGALERDDDIMIITYDNEAYSNTGIQRSGATPFGASTTTTPAGLVSIGKKQWKKNLPMIAVAHGSKYVASASIAYPQDFQTKIKKAMTIKGAKYIHIHTPCPTGWGFDSSKTIEVARLAVQTGMWILYEIEDGKFKKTMNPELKPVDEYLKMQKRFKHLKEKEIKIIQDHINVSWKELDNLEKSGVNLRTIL